MKKSALIFIVACLSLTMFTGCGKSNKKTEEKPTTTDTAISSEDKSENKKKGEKKEEKRLPDISSKALSKERQADAKVKLKKFDITQSAFKLNGEIYQLPFSYARISDEWTFDLEDYGFKNTFKLEPGQRTTDNIILRKNNTDYTITVGLMNPYDVPISVEESQIWSVTLSIKDCDTKPLLRLPAKITWNSSLVDVTLAYSDPTVPFTHDLETKSYFYTYMKDYNHYLNLEISEEDGLVSFTMKRYE